VSQVDETPIQFTLADKLTFERLASALERNTTAMGALSADLIRMRESMSREIEAINRRLAAAEQMQTRWVAYAGSAGVAVAAFWAVLKFAFNRG